MNLRILFKIILLIYSCSNIYLVTFYYKYVIEYIDTGQYSHDGILYFINLFFIDIFYIIFFIVICYTLKKKVDIVLFSLLMLLQNLPIGQAGNSYPYSSFYGFAFSLLAFLWGLYFYYKNFKNWQDMN